MLNPRATEIFQLFEISLAQSDLHLEKVTFGFSLENRLEGCQNQCGKQNREKERKRHRTESGRVPTFNGWGKKDEPMNNFSQEVAMRGGESKISS